MEPNSVLSSIRRINFTLFTYFSLEKKKDPWGPAPGIDAYSVSNKRYPNKVLPARAVNGQTPFGVCLKILTVGEIVCV
jgi:hypothetical protein